MMVNTLQHHFSTVYGKFDFENPLALSIASISNHDSIILIAK